ncbi:MAG TPA: hypothetical protein VIT91_10915 [Chthoniobacterales bacterium]
MEKTKRTRGRRRWGCVEIERLLGEYRASGLTQHQFALAHGVGLSTLTRWLRRQRRRAVARLEREPVGVDLVEVTLAGSRAPDNNASSCSGYDYALELPGVGQLHVRRGFDGGEIEHLIGLLRRQGRP